MHSESLKDYVIEWEIMKKFLKWNKNLHYQRWDILWRQKKLVNVEENMENYSNGRSDQLTLNRLSLNIDKSVFKTFDNYCDTIQITMKNEYIESIEGNEYPYVVDIINWDGLFMKSIHWKIHKMIENHAARDFNDNITWFNAPFHRILSYGIKA